MHRAAAILILLAGGCGDGGAVRAMLGGARGLEAVESADRLELSLVSPRVGPNLSHWERWAAPLPVAGPWTPDPETRRRLTQLLLDPETYVWPAEGMGHIHAPHHKLTATRGASRLDVVFCFPCTMVVMFLDGKQAGATALKHPAWKELLAVFEAAFPGQRAKLFQD